MTTAVASRKQESVFGNKVATLERRAISLFNRSITLEVRSRRRCGSGKLNTVKPSGRFSSAH